MPSSSKGKYNSYLFMFAILLIASIFTTFVSSNTTVAVALCVFPIILLLLETFNHLKINAFFLLWLCWNLINVLHIGFDSNSYFLRVLIFQNIIFVLIFISSQYSCSEIQFRSIYKTANITAILLCILEIIFSLTGRTEGFSFVLFGLLFFFLCDKGKKKYLKLLLMSLAFWFGRSRSSILMIIFCLLFALVINRVRKSKTKYRITFIIVSVVTYLIPQIYIWLYHSKYSNYLNQLSRSIFEKNFFSGRNLLWIQINEWLDQYNILWGIGSDFVGGTYSQQLGMSTHNVCLFLLGQGGLVLVVLFFILLYNIYMRLFKYLEDPIIFAGSVFMLGLMIRSSFDLILIANQFVPSMYSWLAIALTLSYSNYLKNKDETSIIKSERNITGL